MADQKLTTLANDLVPILRRKLGTLQTGTGAAGVNGGGDPGDHAHPDYLTEAEADLLYAALDSFVAHAANSSAHHPRQHSVLSTDDHTIVAALGQVVGATAENTLGLFSSASDARAGGIIVRTAASTGAATLGKLGVGVVPVNAIDVGSSTFGALTGTRVNAQHASASSGFNMGSGADDRGWILWDAANGGGVVLGHRLAGVNYGHAIIIKGADVTVEPSGDLILQPGDDILLHPDSAIYFDKPIYSDQTTDGAASITINPETGVIDTDTIQAAEAYFDAVIAKAKWATLGEIELTRSVAPLARPFTIPAAGASDTMYVAYLEGLPGYAPLGDGNIARIHFFQDGGLLQQAVTWAGYDGEYAAGVAGGSGDPYYSNDFDTGTMDAVLETGANNALTAADVAEIYADGGNDTMRITSNATNIHVHYNGTGYASLADYEVTGRFKLLASGVGFGITVYSDYPHSDSYYRIRRYASKPDFHVENHGSGFAMSGTTQSSYNPADNLNVWQKFRVQVEASGTGETELRARFWLDGDTEPTTWDVDCQDNNEAYTAGTAGFWFMSGGPNNILIDDWEIAPLATTTASNTTVQIAIPSGTTNGDQLILVITYTDGDTVALLNAPAWTLRDSAATAAGVRTDVWSRQWNYSNSTQYTITCDSPDEVLATMFAVRYAGDTSPVTVDVAAFNSGSPQPPSMSVEANSLHVVMFARHDGTAMSWSSRPAEYTASPFSVISSGYGHRYYRALMSADNGTYAPTWGAPVYAGEYVAVAVNIAPGVEQTTAFFVGSAWGTVAALSPQPGDVTAEEVAYTWTTLGSYRTDDNDIVDAVGKIAQIDTAVQDYGPPSGDNVMLLSTRDQVGAPYIRLFRHTGFNAGTGRLNTQLIGQIGQLAGLGIDGVDTTDEPGMIFQKTDGRKVILSVNQLLMEGASSYWFDFEGQKILSILDDDGIAVHTRVTESDAGIAAGERNYVFKDASNNIVGGLYYSAFVPANPILPEGQRIALRISGDGRDGVDADVVASQTDGSRAARASLHAYSGGDHAYFEVGHDGTDSYVESNASVYDMPGVFSSALTTGSATEHLKMQRVGATVSTSTWTTVLSGLRGASLVLIQMYSDQNRGVCLLLCFNYNGTLQINSLYSQFFTASAPASNEVQYQASGTSLQLLGGSGYAPSLPVNIGLFHLDW